MKNTVKLFTLAISIVLFSCSKEQAIDIPADSEISKQSLVSNSTVAKSAVPVSVVDYEGVVRGSSTLHRNKNGITVNFKTDGLISGNAYTMWFVVFGDEPGPPASTHAAGHVVGKSGKGNFSGHLSVGDILKNPLTNEVHVVLRTHGPAQPGMIPAQIQTIDGGCTSGFPSGPILHADSDVVGYCSNIQVAINPALD